MWLKILQKQNNCKDKYREWKEAVGDDSPIIVEYSDCGIPQEYKKKMKDKLGTLTSLYNLWKELLPKKTTTLRDIVKQKVMPLVKVFNRSRKRIVTIL